MNRKYPVVDERINKTYVKDSAATLNNKLYDPYVKFFRWAVDRLQGRDGIVCFVSNNSFVDQIAFDGMRKHLLQDFTQIYHLDFHGNVRKNPKLSGTTHNVFGIQVGVGITVAIRRSQSTKRAVYYHRVPELWNRGEKLAFLTEKGSITSIEWIELQPDEKYNWLIENLRSEFKIFLPLGTKKTKSAKGMNGESVFKMYSLGVATNRDRHVYSFDSIQLSSRVRTFIDLYNTAVDRRKREGSETNVSALIDTNDARIKWTRQVKASLERLQYSQFEKSHLRNCLYRPFTRKKLYFDDFWNEERYQQYLFFPTPATESENVAILVGGYGRKHFAVLSSNQIPDLNFYADPAQCFPYYIYYEDGSNKRENITDWALTLFQTKYGTDVTKWDIFHYVYGLLHHPGYPEHYAENLKRDLPHIPLLRRNEAFLACVSIGRQLMDMHLHYEQVKEYPLKWIENKNVPFSWRVEKMKLTPDKTAVIFNESLTLTGIPPECYQYRLGNRSALDWVIDQYQVSEDKRSGIVSDPNNLDDEEYIARLVGKVITVSVVTVRLVNELAQVVKIEDWLSETVKENLK